MNDAAMDDPSAPQGRQGFATLRRLVRQQPPPEPCELCSAPIGSEHQHVVEPSARRLLCACDPCAILFGDQGGGRYRRVPRTIEFLPEIQLGDARWDSLMIPINIAFFLYSSADQRVVALYPSPAGPVESLLPLEAWAELVHEYQRLGELEPDVEALLVNRLANPHECYRVPINECYALVGLLRKSWRGLSGGTEVWQEMARFFVGLKARSVTRSRGAQVHA